MDRLAREPKPGCVCHTRKENEGMRERIGEEASKQWESEWARRLPLDEPWIVRLDGRSFHSWTRGLDRPFDERLREAMARTTEAVVEEAGAWHGYTQSDEVNLVLWCTAEQEPAFGGKLQKIVSLLAARATATFNEAIRELHPSHARRMGTGLFDARIFAVPGRGEAAAAIEERSRDCRRNAVRSIGHVRYGHKALLGVGTRELIERLESDDDPVQAWPGRHIGGIAISKRRVKRRFKAHELDKLPPRHAARLDPQVKIERTEVVRVENPTYRDTAQAVGMIFGWRDEIVEC